MAGGAGEDLFSVVAQTRDLVANTGGLPDAELAQALSDQLAAIDTVHNSVLGSTARLAGRAKSLELRQSMYEDAEIAATRSLADVEDADVAEVVYRLQMERNQFEALLAGSATLLKPTLMDFLT
jgi:flagellin-like hook-associated protein FlgL